MSQLTMYTNLPYAVEVTPEVADSELVYLAVHPELPGCMSHGSTPDEAIESLAEARELYISALLERDLEIPLPKVMTETSTVGTSEKRIIWELHAVESGPSEPSPPFGIDHGEPIPAP